MHDPFLIYLYKSCFVYSDIVLNGRIHFLRLIPAKHQALISIFAEKPLKLSMAIFMQLSVRFHIEALLTYFW